MLSAKRILQNLCQRQIGWDDALLLSVAQEWKVWLHELHQLDEIERLLKPFTFGEVASAQLHHFADVSENGCGNVAYLLMQNIHGHPCLYNGEGTCSSFKIYHHTLWS